MENTRFYESLMVDPRKTTLLNALKDILSPLEQTRRKAEELIKALEVIEYYGMYLVDYIISDKEKYEIRLLSVVLLNQYVHCHWSKHSPQFQRPEISRISKDYIKNVLPTTFTESSVNIRTNVGRVIALIALFEYPDYWPDFSHRMIELMKDSNSCKSHGAMQSLFQYIQYSNNLSFGFVIELVGQLLEIISNTNQLYSLRSRCHAVKMIKLLVPEMRKMVTIKDGKCMGNNETVEGFIRLHSETFLNVLINEHFSEIGYIELQNNIIQCFERIIISFPHVMPAYLPRLLPVIWKFLVNASNQYKGALVLENSTLPSIDEDGNVVNTDSQIIIIFEFVRTLCAQDVKLSSNIYDVLIDIAFHTIVCMQLTPIIMADWNKNYDQFINDDNIIEYQVRYAAYSLLNDMMTICNKKKTISAFCQALCRHIQHAEQQRKNNHSDWWQGLEASMYALGCFRSFIIEAHSLNELSDFNLMGYLNIAAQYTQENDIPLLVGRCLWLCAMFSKIISVDTLQIVVESTIRHFQFSDSIFVRVYAIRALKIYCEPELVNRTKPILENHLRGILNCLCNIVNQFGTNLLSLTLETMSLFVKVNVEFTAASMEIIVPFVISIFLKHDDPIITSLMMDLIRGLVQIQNVLPQLEEFFAPTLHSVLTTSVTLATTGVHIIALETLGIIVRNQQGPINESFLQLLFPAAVDMILNSNDFHVLQAGGECIINFLFSGAAEQVCGYRNSEGRLGIDFIIDIINKLLDPYGYEYSAKFISFLIIILIVKAGEHIFTRLELLLRAILSKMQCTECESNMHSLISIFSYLAYTKLDAVINFLSTIPGPNGEAALEFVLTEWVFIHHTKSSQFDYKIGIVGLIKIIEYGILNDHFVLQTMAIEDTDNCVIPVMAKILKVLLSSFDLIQKQPETNSNISEELISNHEMDLSIMALLPVLKELNISDHIQSFFLTYQNNEKFSSFLIFLNEYEVDVMSRIGIDLSKFMIE